WYPKENPPWEPGSFPIAPIEAEGQWKYGRALVKPKLEGLFVPDIAKKYRKGKKPLELSDLPPEMIQSMRDWYRVSQAASAHVKVTPIGGKERPLTCLDINPENLVWVS